MYIVEHALYIWDFEPGGFLVKTLPSLLTSFRLSLFSTCTYVENNALYLLYLSTYRHTQYNHTDRLIVHDVWTEIGLKSLC